MPTDPIAVARTLEVGASPVDVYAVVADVARRPRWLHELKHVDWNGGQVEKGDRFEGESQLLLHDFVGHSEVLDADAPGTLAERVHLGARFESRWTFEATTDGGTRVTHAIALDYPAGPLGRIERWVLRRRLGRMQRRSLDALRREVS